jgi:hypothetical protein
MGLQETILFARTQPHPNHVGAGVVDGADDECILFGRELSKRRRPATDDAKVRETPLQVRLPSRFAQGVTRSRREGFWPASECMRDESSRF